MGIVQWCARCAFGCALIWASVVDVHSRIIPNKVVLLGVAAWFIQPMALCLAWFALGEDSVPLLVGMGFAASVPGCLLGGVLVPVFAAACAAVVGRICHRSALGAGDVKLLCPIGLFMGALGGFAALGIACALAAVFCAGSALLRKPVRDFPFAPFLAAGCATVAAARFLGM